MHSSVTKVLIFCKTKTKTCSCLSYFNTAGIFFACERRYGLVKKRTKCVFSPDFTVHETNTRTRGSLYIHVCIMNTTCRVWKCGVWALATGRVEVSCKTCWIWKNKERQTCLSDALSRVVPPGIEPGTQGFSVLCSTN